MYDAERDCKTYYYYYKYVEHFVADMIFDSHFNRFDC